MLWRNAKRRAEERGIPFELQLEDIRVPDTCPVLGLTLQPGTHKHHDASPSLDRIIPAKGYVPGNVWVISHRANSIKRDASLDELRALVRALEAL